MALDGETRGVFYDADDAYCLDNQRLVAVSENGKTIEYRTFPDTQVKIIGHFDDSDESYFQAFWPSGEMTDYGTTAETRPLASSGLPRVWLAAGRRDVRGNGVSFAWCFAENDDEGYVAEYALDHLDYTTFDGVKSNHSIAFVYGTKEDARHVYAGGMQLQQSLRLDEIQMRAEDTLARRYVFDYEQSATTGRTRLVSIEECGLDGSCTAPTRFQYENAERGFERIETNIVAPLSRRASPIWADLNEDGLADWLVADMTPQSTSSNPMTEWRLARNTGHGYVQRDFLQ